MINESEHNSSVSLLSVSQGFKEGFYWAAFSSIGLTQEEFTP